MGDYTEIYVRANIVNDCPNEALHAFRFLFQDRNTSFHPGTFNHAFFRTARWDSIGASCSFYHIPFAVGGLYSDDIGGYYICSRSDLKNYDNEIPLFFDWAKQYFKPGFIGYSLYEGDKSPTLFFK